jgi:hypothetical protein
MKSKSKWRLVLLLVAVSPFFGFSLVMIYAGIRELLSGNYAAGFAALAFGTVFGGFASLFIWGALRGHSKGRQIKQARASQEPWQRREDWARGQILCFDRKALVLTWTASIGLLALLFPLVPEVREKWAAGEHAIIVALLFPSAGVVLLIRAIYLTLRWKRFGESVFRMLSIPGVIGGNLDGVIQVGAKVRPQEGFALRLHCTRRVTAGRRKKRHTVETILWEDKKTLRKELLEDDPRRTGIPVHFTIPDHCHPTHIAGNTVTLWRLEASAKVHGVDYFARFEVPVFRTKLQESATPFSSGDFAARFEAPPQFERTLRASGIQIHSPLPGRLELVFAAARHKRVALVATLFLAGGIAGLILLFRKEAFSVGSLVLGLMDGALLIACLNLWLHETRTVADSAMLRIRHRWWCVKRERLIASGEILAIDTHTGMASNDTVYYDVRVHTRALKTVVAGSGILGKREAEWVAEKLREALQLPRQEKGPVEETQPDQSARALGQ